MLERFLDRSEEAQAYNTAPGDYRIGGDRPQITASTKPRYAITPFRARLDRRKYDDSE